MLNSIIPEAGNNFITASTYSTVSLCLRRDPTGCAATEGWPAGERRSEVRGTEGVGGWVAELLN